MRIGSVSLLVLSAFALAACEGTPSTGSSTNADSLDLCGLGCPFGKPASGAIDPDDPKDGNDSSTDGGNTANLSATTADTTITLESSKIVKPGKGQTSLSLLTSGSLLTPTTSQILDSIPANKPAKLTIQIDTNTSSNGAWPTPVQMDQYPEGTNALDPTGGNNGGAGAGYREYRAISQVAGKERDESLQVWAWTDSYATQYRNTPSGGEAIQQAWSFGGKKTPLTAMPTVTATYNGRFVATAKTANYVKPSAADIDPNALWRVQGASSLTANFGTKSVTGLLTPETWTSYQDGITATYMKVVGSPATVAQPNYGFYDTTVRLDGTITGNAYAGAANLRGPLGASGPFISGDQTMYGGFFGASGGETAGVFHVTGVDPYPVGGQGGINDDKRGYLTIQGAFHGQ
jgi:hypothetical protein